MILKSRIRKTKKKIIEMEKFVNKKEDGMNRSGRLTRWKLKPTKSQPPQNLNFVPRPSDFGHFIKKIIKMARRRRQSRVLPEKTVPRKSENPKKRKMPNKFSFFRVSVILFRKSCRAPKKSKKILPSSKLACTKSCLTAIMPRPEKGPTFTMKQLP